MDPTSTSGHFVDGVAFVDEEFMPVAQARIPLTDWGFLHSDATYDVAHVWGGRFFRLDDHLARFEDGMAKLHMRLPLSRSEIRDILLECVRKSGLRNAYVEMVCTRGMPAPGSRDPRTCSNRFYAFAVPFIWIADPSKQETGLHAAISEIERISSRSVDATVKNYHWLDFVTGLYRAYDQGAETVILCDRDGHITEGPGFNVFAVKDGHVTTPETGVLQGITRKTVMELADELSIPLQQQPIPPAELRAADEVFASSTAGGVIPITRLDGDAVGNGGIGPITGRIRDAYWQCHNDDRLTLAVRYR